MTIGKLMCSAAFVLMIGLAVPAQAQDATGAPQAIIDADLANEGVYIPEGGSANMTPLPAGVQPDQPAPPEMVNAGQNMGADMVGDSSNLYNPDLEETQYAEDAFTPSEADVVYVEPDPVGECSAQHKFPSDISECIVDMMKTSDDALAATYKKAVKDAAALDGSARPKKHGKELVRTAMEFDVNREKDCLQQEAAMAEDTKVEKRVRKDHFNACRTKHNHRRIAELGGDINTYVAPDTTNKLIAGIGALFNP